MSEIYGEEKRAALRAKWDIEEMLQSEALCNAVNTISCIYNKLRETERMRSVHTREGGNSVSGVEFIVLLRGVQNAIR